MLKKVILFLIFLYQKAISPYLKPSCRYIPSCSEYAKQSVIKYGAFRGSFLAILRVIRCNPLAKKIYDPVPWFLSEMVFFYWFLIYVEF